MDDFALTEAEVTELRTAVLDLLPDTCTIQSVTLTSDGQGGNTSTWATQESGVRCRVDHVSAVGSRLRVAGDSLRPFGSWVLTVPWNTSISTANRVVYLSDTYKVQEVVDDQSWRAVRRVYMERVSQ